MQGEWAGLERGADAEEGPGNQESQASVPLSVVNLGELIVRSGRPCEDCSSLLVQMLCVCGLTFVVGSVCRCIWNFLCSLLFGAQISEEAEMQQLSEGQERERKRRDTDFNAIYLLVQYPKVCPTVRFKSWA